MKKSHRVTQGDSFQISVPFLKDGVAEPIDGWELIMTVKSSSDDPDGAALFQRTSANNGVQPLGTTGWVVLGVPSNTKNQTPGRYQYDLQAKNTASGVVATLESGFFFIDPEITRAG